MTTPNWQHNKEGLVDSMLTFLASRPSTCCVCTGKSVIHIHTPTAPTCRCTVIKDWMGGLYLGVKDGMQRVCIHCEELWHEIDASVRGEIWAPHQVVNDEHPDGMCLCGTFLLGDGRCSSTVMHCEG